MTITFPMVLRTSIRFCFMSCWPHKALEKRTTNGASGPSENLILCRDRVWSAPVACVFVEMAEKRYFSTRRGNGAGPVTA